MEALTFPASPALELSVYTYYSGLKLFFDVKEHILRSFGCIAEAVAYLHEEETRYKDLKPSQILLLPEGL